MSSQTLVDVNLQGMDRNFVPNGSYDAIGLGIEMFLMFSENVYIS